MLQSNSPSLTEGEKVSFDPDTDSFYNKSQHVKSNRSSIGKSSLSKPSTPNAIGLNNGGKIKLRERRSNSGIKSSQNPNRASYPSALLPTVTENRSFDNRGQYNSQSYQRGQSLNKQDSDTNLSISLNGVVGGINSIPTSRNNSSERLSGTDGEYFHYKY